MCIRDRRGALIRRMGVLVARGAVVRSVRSPAGVVMVLVVVLSGGAMLAPQLHSWSVRWNSQCGTA
eukprot:6981995-Prorocentrum_lima.AAC.1